MKAQQPMLDPTKTAAIRRKFIRELSRRFALLKSRLYELIIVEDAFGLKPVEQPFTTNAYLLDLSMLAPDIVLTTCNQRWKFKNNTGKVAAFRDWLSGQLNEVTGDIANNPHQGPHSSFLQEAYRRGLARGYDDVGSGSYDGGKLRFVTDIAAKGDRIDNQDLISSRFHSDLDSIIQQTKATLTRSVADDLVRDLPLSAIVDNLTERVDKVAIIRAATAADTEITRAHAEGQLDSFEELGVDNVTVAAEWITQEGACPLCLPLNNVVLSVTEARGMIPRHARCKCAWVPVNEDDDLEGKKTSAKEIRTAIGTSVRKQGNESDWSGATARIGKGRPLDNISTNAIPTQHDVHSHALIHDTYLDHLSLIDRVLHINFDPTQERDEHGKFAKEGAGGGSGSGGGHVGDVESPTSKVDVAANRPSLPEERRKDAKPVATEWADPPPKKGKKGGGKVTRPKGEESQTKIGDLGEVMAQQLGFRNILPEGKRNFTAAEVAKKGSSIDLEYDHSGRLYELKLCNTSATEYRLKAKKEEKDDKLKYAKQSKAEAWTMVAVRDVDTGDVHFYGAKKQGLIGAEVSSKNYDYLGKVKLPGTASTASVAPPSSTEPSST